MRELVDYVFDTKKDLLLAYLDLQAQLSLIDNRQFSLFEFCDEVAKISSICKNGKKHHKIFFTILFNEILVDSLIKYLCMKLNLNMDTLEFTKPFAEFHSQVHLIQHLEPYELVDLSILLEFYPYDLKKTFARSMIRDWTGAFAMPQLLFNNNSDKLIKDSTKCKIQTVNGIALGRINIPNSKFCDLNIPGLYFRFTTTWSSDLKSAKYVLIFASLVSMPLRTVQKIMEFSLKTQHPVIELLSPDLTSIKITCSISDFSKPVIQNCVSALSHELKIDIVLQAYDNFITRKKLVLFDLDSTLIQQETIDELGKRIGKTEEIAKITERAMNGELDFKDSLIQRVRLLKGTSVEVWDEIKSKVTYSLGVKETCKVLEKYGIKMAVVSGGFVSMVEFIQKELKIDWSFANDLEIEKGVFTGNLKGPLVGSEEKRNSLKELMTKYHLHKQETVAVGDGANDLPMLSAAGLGVAFQAKQVVKDRINAQINYTDMKTLLYLIGYCLEDFN